MQSNAEQCKAKQINAMMQQNAKQCKVMQSDMKLTQLKTILLMILGQAISRLGGSRNQSERVFGEPGLDKALVTLESS